MIFLVDFENVHSGGLIGLEALNEKDTVYIFYSVNSNTLTFDALSVIAATRAKVVCLRSSCGSKNALDFQLASFVGYLAAASEDRCVYIISGDSGFSHLKPFWEQTMNCNNFFLKFASSVNKALFSENRPDFVATKTTASLASFKIAVSDDDKAALTAKLQNKQQPKPAAPPVSPANKPEENNNSPKDKQNKAAADGDLKVTEKNKNKPKQDPKPPTTGKDTHGQQQDTSAESNTLNVVLEEAGLTSEVNPNVLCRIIKSTKDKQQFYTGMTKEFGMDKGLRIYRLLRSKYTSLKRFAGIS